MSRVTARISDDHRDGTCVDTPSHLSEDTGRLIDSGAEDVQSPASERDVSPGGCRQQAAVESLLDPSPL